MATIRRLRSSLKLESKDNDDFVRIPSTPTLKRSNAKLKRKNNTSAIHQSPEESDYESLPQALPAPKPLKLGHSLRLPYANDNNGSLLSLPYTNYFDPDQPPTFDRVDSKQSESSNGKRKGSRSISKIFGRVKTKRPQPVDNFTKWDSERPSSHQSLHGHGQQLYEVGGSRGNSSAASALFSVGAVAAGPSKPRQRRSSFESNPYDEATQARMSWRRLGFAHDLSDSEFDELFPRRSKQKEKRQAIFDIDWAEYTNGEEIRKLIRAYGDSASSEHIEISPVDSGIGLVEANEPSVGKGKGRAIDEDSEVFDEELYARLDSIFAHEIEFDEEWLRQEKRRAEQSGAIRIQEQERLDYLGSEVKRIAELHKQYRLAREQQEENDRVKAEELLRSDETAVLADELLKDRECVCCGDEKKLTLFPPHPPTYQCEHLPDTCFDCMHSWMASEFATKGTTDLLCPQCPQTLSFSDVQRAADETTFLAYEKLLVRTALGSLPDFAWCLNPDGCDSGQENRESNNYMECVVCKYRQCLKHQCAWHADETCEQYDYRTSGDKARDEEEQTAKMLDDVSKKCPGEGCGWRIQKSDGCDHMTCRKCRWEFCWHCLASHREIKRVGNTAHEEWCKFHSNNLETTWPFNMHA